MEGELFASLYVIVQEEAKLRARPTRVRYSDLLIVLVYLWAVLHDRPVCWACNELNWPKEMAWLSLPSAPTMSRRLRTLSCWLLITALYDHLRTLDTDGSAGDRLCRRIDTKPLAVGGFSKDRDARRGYATGGLARGYKLAAAWGKGVVPDALFVTSLKVSDQQCGMAILDGLVQNNPAATGYLLADSTHDTNPLHEYAASLGFQLLTPRKKPGTALGHREHCQARLRSIELLEGPGDFRKRVYKPRGDIERDFAHLCGFGGGLQPLPSWVRHPQRVVRWVVAKLLINGIRLCQIRGVTV
jgi:Transposase DDE domain